MTDKEGYEPFFGLSEAPFSLAPDPRFLFASASHSAALAQVGYALQRREPLVVITGEIGTGKTLLCRTILQRLPGKTFLSVINDPLLERDDLLKQMLEDFGVISKDRTRLTATSRHELVQALSGFLSSLGPLQAHAVVIVDEAQHLQPEVLEQIRLLSNIDDGRGTALEIILVGQPDLEQLLARPELQQLRQRVSRRLRVVALNDDEVRQYIEHRLSLARGSKSAADVASGMAFAPDAIAAVAKLSHGIPRVINLLCDRSLEDAFASKRHVIDAGAIAVAAGVLGIGEQPAPFVPVPVSAPVAAFAEVPVPTSSPFAEPVVSSDRVHGEDRLVETSVTKEPARVELIHTPDDVETPVPFDMSMEFDTLASVNATGQIEALPDRAMLAEPIAVGEPAMATGMPARTKYLVAALVVVVVGAAIAFGPRIFQTPPAAPRPVTSAAAPARPPRPAASGATGVAAGTSAAGGATATSAQPAERDTGTAAARAPAGAGTVSPPLVTPSATGERFELVVASFRTDARASSVASEVAALGLPIRRRVLDGWQQVMAGPFASRAEAVVAQQRLDAAGLTGAQIVPTATVSPVVPPAVQPGQ